MWLCAGDFKLTLEDSLMAIAQEALAPVFATELLDNLLPGPLNQFGVADSEGRETNDR